MCGLVLPQFHLWYRRGFNCEQKEYTPKNLTWEQIQNIRPQDIRGIKCPNFLQQIPKFNTQFSYEFLLEVIPNH